MHIAQERLTIETTPRETAFGKLKALAAGAAIVRRELGFENVAAELRAQTSGRNHTPSEVLQREGRDER